MRTAEVAVARPGDRLRDRPPAGALTVEAELGGQSVEAVQDVALRVAELEGTDDRGDRELALARERLRVDHEPRLALCGQHVVAVQVLVHEDLLALGRRELLQSLERRLE